MIASLKCFNCTKNCMESLSSMALACIKAKKGISLFSNAVSSDCLLPKSIFPESRIPEQW